MRHVPRRRSDARATKTPRSPAGRFFANWTTLSVNDLFGESSGSGCRPNNPGHLTRQQDADILSYLFAFNKFPPGSTELPTQGESLKQIRIDVAVASTAR